VRITVLGKSPSWPDAGGACSGYLVEDDETCLLLDCGSGVLAELRRVCDYVDVHGVVVSHMHADHFFDLIPYACALTYAPRQQPVPVAGAAAGAQTGLVEKAFQAREYDVAGGEHVGTLRLRFQPVPHFIATNAVEVTSEGGGGRFVFGADHRPTSALCGFADETDLLMLEATLPRAERDGPRGHLTPAEAGEHATRCAAARLVLTHMSDELDAQWALAEARRAFAGPVEIAQAGAVYTV
jgi:ribonuclease BN (tRNA processing enzyme)